jgi:hypothetical protein
MYQIYVRRILDLVPTIPMNRLPIGQCKLCLQTRELQDSHLMPAALYRQGRLDGDPNPNPTMLTMKGRIQTAKAIKDYVLCRDCEQRLNKCGERYTMTQVTQKAGRSFPLLRTLYGCQMTKSALGFDYYDHTTSPMIDRDKIGYFALSVFWRSGVHSWRRPFGADNQIHLGEHQEALRLYLLSLAPFPAKMMLYFIVCNDPYSQNRFYTASKSSHPGNTTTHAFLARGLNFFLMTGEDITEMMGTLCFMTGKDRWIMVRSCQEKVAEAEMKLEAIATINQLIQKSRKKPAPPST